MSTREEVQFLSFLRTNGFEIIDSKRTGSRVTETTLLYFYDSPKDGDDIVKEVIKSAEKSGIKYDISSAMCAHTMNVKINNVKTNILFMQRGMF